MIITCPNCSTKYEVADQAIGATGRKVQCANCHRSWKATAPENYVPAPKPRIVGGTDTDLDEAPAETAERDRLFGADAETELDKAFAAEEEKVLAGAESAEENEPEDESIEDMVDEQTGKLDHRLLSRRRRDMHRRQQKHVSRLPLARLRRAARVLSLLVLAAIIGGGYVFRNDIVRAYPNLGGLYAMVGIDVNIYGLIFTKVETLRTLRDGDDVTIITANIRSIVDHTVRVPPVLVSILNADEQTDLRMDGERSGCQHFPRRHRRLRDPADLGTDRRRPCAAGFRFFEHVSARVFHTTYQSRS